MRKQLKCLWYECKSHENIQSTYKWREDHCNSCHQNITGINQKCRASELISTQKVKKDNQPQSRIAFTRILTIEWGHVTLTDHGRNGAYLFCLAQSGRPQGCTTQRNLGFLNDYELVAPPPLFLPLDCAKNKKWILIVLWSLGRLLSFYCLFSFLNSR